jgi:hypothetical protein
MELPSGRRTDEGGDMEVGEHWKVRNAVYLQQIKKKAKAEGKTCHAKTMLSLERPK